MQTGQPSRTSILVAAARAFGAREPDPGVRNPDYLAERIVGPAERQMIAEHPIVAALDQDYPVARQNLEVAGISNMMVARTCFIDQRVQRALEAGAAQLVILGAGFDTRAYRFLEMLQGKTVFEVDFGPTQAIKRQRLAEVLTSVPDNVVFVPIDFQTELLLDVLPRAGYRPDLRTVFIWEGVSMYLAEGVVRATLRTIAQLSPPGSVLVMDFAEQALLDVLRKFPDAPQNRHTTGWGEPWIFGVPDGREREFFRQCGLETREVMKMFGKEARRRYLTRADGTTLAVRRVRGTNRASATIGVADRFRMLFSFLALLTRRSKWYAVAELVVPERI